MKHLILIVITLTTLHTAAQNERRHHEPDHKQMMKDFSPEERATIKTKHMTLDLDLNKTQQTQVKALLLKQESERQQKMESRKTDENDSKQKSKEKRVALINERLDDQIEMKAQMKEILTPEQYKKWELKTSKRHKKGARKHKKKPRH